MKRGRSDCIYEYSLVIASSDLSSREKDHLMEYRRLDGTGLYDFLHICVKVSGDCFDLRVSPGL